MREEGVARGVITERLGGYLGCSVLGLSISGGSGETEMPIVDGLAGGGDEVAGRSSRGENPGWWEVGGGV